MELVPWRPLGGELSSFRREMDRLWNHVLGEKAFSGKFAEEWAPSVDISETKDNFVVKAELPGLDTEDVNVSISGDILTIKGEKRKETEDKDEHHHYIERYAGSFQRVFQLPSGVKGDGIEATFNKGILKITLPKVEEAKKKEIKIKAK